MDSTTAGGSTILATRQFVHARLDLGLTPLNLNLWAKTNAGMSSLYRSQHELLPPFKKGHAPYVNNVKLGGKGRRRSNVWTYLGASSLGSDARRGLQNHPTVKPTAMLQDALLVANSADNAHSDKSTIGSRRVGVAKWSKSNARRPPSTAGFDPSWIFCQPRPNDRGWPGNEPASREGARGEG